MSKRIPTRTCVMCSCMRAYTCIYVDRMEVTSGRFFAVFLRENNQKRFSRCFFLALVLKKTAIMIELPAVLGILSIAVNACVRILPIYYYTDGLKRKKTTTAFDIILCDLYATTCCCVYGLSNS